MLKKVLGLVFISFSMFMLSAIDPFSHIKITSNKATCQKSKDSPHTFIFNYLEKVNVLLADSSKITADSLEVILNSKSVNVFDKAERKPRSKKQEKSSENLSHVKQITFKNHVCISNQNRVATADSAIINLLENTCKLDGNVKIKQTKLAQSDIPLEVESNQALINLKTSEVTLLGSSLEPVSTVLELNKNVLSPEAKQRKK